jgi:ribose transport system permease protein
MSAENRAAIKRLLHDHGMAGVLLLLGLYYSWATYQEQQPRGAEAARRLTAQINRTVASPGPVLIVARTAEDDEAFAGALEAALRRDGYKVAGRITGDPRAARQALENLESGKQPLAAIATTADCSSWTVLEGIPAKYPTLGPVRLLYASSYKWPTFLKPDNLLNVANQIVVVAILAAGMTLVILTGGIDLSVGSLIALSAVVTTWCIREWGGGVGASAAALVACSLAGIMVCAGIGGFSGLMVTSFKVPPFIATLAVMQVANGLAFILARGASIYEVPESYTWLGRGVGWLGIPHAVLLMAAVYMAAHVLLARTAMGRHIYAVGGNVQAARFAGVRVNRVLMVVYTVCGALAGLGGVITASQLKSGSPTYGASYELYVIAAVVVGGASLGGGEGRISGTLIGAFIIAVIQNGMNLTGVESYTQKVVLGLVILGAVLLDMAKKQGWHRSEGSQ